MYNSDNGDILRRPGRHCGQLPSGYFRAKFSIDAVYIRNDGSEVCCSHALVRKFSFIDFLENSTWGKYI